MEKPPVKSNDASGTDQSKDEDEDVRTLVSGTERTTLEDGPRLLSETTDPSFPDERPKWHPTPPVSIQQQIERIKRFAYRPESPEKLVDGSIHFFRKYNETKDEHDLSMSLELSYLAVRLLPAADDRLSLFQRNYGNLLLELWKESRNSEFLDGAVQYYKLAADTAPEGSRSQFASEAAEVLRRSYFSQFKLQDLLEASLYYERAIAGTPLPAERKQILYNNYAQTLLFEYNQTKRKGALERGITILRDLLESFKSQPVDWVYGKVSHTLGKLLTYYFEETKVRAHIDEAISNLEKVLALTRTDSERMAFLIDLARAFEARFDLYDSISDADDAIRLYREASTAQINSHDLRLLTNFPRLLTMRAGRVGGSVDQLNEAVSFLREALSSSKPAECPPLLTNLAGALTEKYNRTGSIDYLNEALEKYREAAADENNSERARYLTNLSHALRWRFEWKGDLNDLVESIDLSELALEIAKSRGLPVDSIVYCLGMTYREKFRKTGLLSDISNSIDYFESIIPQPLQNDTRPAYIGGFADALFARSVATGSMNDLNRALELFTAAFNSVSKDHPDLPTYRNGIANSLYLRHVMGGSLGDLNDAIVQFKQAVDASSEIDHTNFCGRLRNLAEALVRRFQIKKKNKDLNDAINSLQTALDLVDSRHRRAIANFSYTIGIAYSLSFGVSQNMEDLDKAIQSYELAEKKTEEAELLSAIAHNLGIALIRKAEMTDNHEDVFKAISVCTRSVESTPVNEPHGADRSLALAKLYRRLHYKHRSRYPNSTKAAIDCYYNAVFRWNNAKASTRIEAAVAAATMREEINADLKAACALLMYAVGLLPEAISLNLDLSDQVRFLPMYYQLAANAASLMLQEGYLEAQTALRCFEIGRGVILAHLLDSRWAVTHIEGAHPELSRRFFDARAVLFDHREDQVNPDTFRLRRNTAHKNYIDALKEIRSLPELNQFLQPPNYTHLSEYNVTWPIVAINVHSRRCDALILKTTGVTALHLSKLKFEDVVLNRSHLLSAISPEQLDKPESQNLFDSVMKWLWESVAEPILQHLNYSSIPNQRELTPQVCWIMGGLLSLFPIHAAGDHQRARETGEPCTVIDRVKSCYSPTFRVLIHALGRAHALDLGRTNPVKALVVAMENTPELSDNDQLKNASKEVAIVKTSLGPNSIVDTFMDPTRQQVLSKMSDYNIIHFTCHGVSDSSDSSKSGLLLSDHRLTFRNLSSIQLTSCRMAFLSACETAVNKHIGLSDEGIHLVSAFLVAGVPTVMGTAWKIFEDDALDVVQMVYEYLFDGAGQIKFEKGLEGLHYIIHSMRARGKRALDWGAYVHYGV
jgi:tetratricopeptide (TPR) repeat protein